MAQAQAFGELFDPDHLEVIEDVAAPSCFDLMRELETRLTVPAIHDDQYGTATMIAAAIFNACKVVDPALRRPSWELSRASLNGHGTDAAFGRLRARYRANDFRAACGPPARPRLLAESTVERADNLANLRSRQ